MDSYLTEVLLILGLVVLNGAFAAAEMALVSSRRAALKAAADKGTAGAERALALVEDPSSFLAAIQLGITLAGFMASATAAVSLAGVLGGWLEGLGVPWLASVSAGLSVFLVTLLVTYVTLVFGELAPKRLGMSRAESFAQAVARPVSILAKVTGPVTWLLARSTDAVAWLLGVRGENRRAVTEEEIRLLVAEQANLLDEEKRMIHEIFDLGDTVAREIMVPRVDMVMLEDTADIAEALRTFKHSGFSRLPVYHEDPDKVAGILLLKDLLLRAAERAIEEPIADLIRPATFVPESKSVLVLLNEMQAARQPIVIVVDEYGGTAGLATIEDIVEEVIGDITDEFDREERFVTQVAEDEWIVDGRIPVEDANDALGLAIPESDEYETMAGWVLQRLGHIPAPGETVPLERATVQVHTVRRRRVARLRVRTGGEDGQVSHSES
jgi:putative hemolysin